MSIKCDSLTASAAAGKTDCRRLSLIRIDAIYRCERNCSLYQCRLSTEKISSLQSSENVIIVDNTHVKHVAFTDYYSVTLLSSCQNKRGKKKSNQDFLTRLDPIRQNFWKPWPDSRVDPTTDQLYQLWSSPSTAIKRPNCHSFFVVSFASKIACEEHRDWEDFNSSRSCHQTE